MAKFLNAFGLQMTEDCLGAPITLIERNVRLAIIELCEFSMAWRVVLDDMDIVAGTNEYALTVPANTRVVSVAYAGDDNLRILPTTMMTLDSMPEPWRQTATNNRASQASWYYLPDRSTIRLVLTPFEAKTAGLSVIVSLKPTQDAKSVEDFLYEDHLEDIRHGALSKILRIPKKEWTDAREAEVNRLLFEKDKRRVKAERYNDFTRKSTLSVLPTNYTGTRRGYPYDDEDCR